MVLAIACLLLLPSRVALAFNSRGIARELGVSRVAFLLVLGIGAIWLLVRLSQILRCEVASISIIVAGALAAERWRIGHASSHLIP